MDSVNGVFTGESYYLLSKPALATVALFQFITTWNDFSGPLLYLNDPEKFPLGLRAGTIRQFLRRPDSLAVGSRGPLYPAAAGPVFLYAEDISQGNRHDWHQGIGTEPRAGQQSHQGGSNARRAGR